MGEYASATAVTVGTTSIEVILENYNRLSATFVNDSDSPIYLSLGQEAKVNAGIRLNANGGAYEINLTNPWYGRVFAVSTAASKVLCVSETGAY